MKKVLLSAIGLLGFAVCFAQSPVVYEDDKVQIIDSVQASFQQIVDSVFTHVDLSQVPSGVLIDRTLSTLDYSNFTGQPDLPDLTALQAWRHHYQVYYRNAVNETQVWQPGLKDSLAVMDSLMRLRDLPAAPTSATLACNLLVSHPQQWRSHYERVQRNVLEASKQYPPLLPRIRKWVEHSDSLLQKVYAIEADSDFTVLNDSNRVDFMSWSQLYRFMNQATIHPQQLPLPVLEDVLNPFMAAGQPTPIVLLDMQYDRIRPDAIEKNLLRFSGIQLYDVAGRTESPYESLSLLAATPAALSFDNSAPSFIIRPELVFGNRQTAIKSIAIDFGDGLGFRQVGFNNPVSIRYTTPGEKRMIFKVTYQDCSFAISHAVIAIREESSTANSRTMRTQDFSGTPDKTLRILGAKYYEGANATGTAYIEYGCGNDRLIKPLIVVEGFNPKQYELLDQATDYGSFLADLIRGNPQLRDNLKAEGYDLVYLNYDDGGTYIQRNAYLLQELIRKINQMKAENGSTEPNVVMGISMGGLVSRYTLADMERLGEAHDTRLFISFDSPHQGANVPLGFQYAAYHLPQIRIAGRSLQTIYDKIGKRYPEIKDSIPSPDIGVQIAENPAARQMLIQQPIIPYGKRIVNNNLYHWQFMQEYQALGYPKKCRNVAVASGSQIGKGQGFEPGDQLLHLQSNSFRTTNYLISGPLFDWARSTNNKWERASIFTLAGLTTVAANLAYGYTADIQVNAVADYNAGSKRIYRTFVAGRILTKPIALEYQEVKVKNALPLDTAPGGLVNYGSSLPNVVKSSFGTGSFCHIPTVSALDIRETLPDQLYLDVQSANILANARTTFEDYDAPNTGFAGELPDGTPTTFYNEFHTSFTSANARLFQQELIGADLPRTFLIKATYNFGEGRTLSTTDRLSHMTVYNGGQLLINANIPIGPGEDAGINPPPLPNTTFEVSVSPAYTCDYSSGEVQIRSGGQLILGEDNPNNKGILRFRQGSTLILKKGSRLVIHPNSQLIIECGATLVFEEGAIIETAGDDSRLAIDGQLQVAEGTTFPYAYTTGNSSPPDVSRITIEGSSWVCAAGTTYRLSNLPEGTEVCWSTEGGQMTVAGSGCGTSVVVSSAGSGTGVLHANIRYAGTCEDVPPAVVTREVKLGAVAPSDINISGGLEGDKLCPNQSYTFTATANFKGYLWSVAGIGEISSGQGTSSIIVTTGSNPNGRVSVSVDNGCGYSHEANKTMIVCNIVSVETYPVPTTNYLNLSITSFFEGEQVTEESADAYEIELYSDQSGLVRKVKSKDKQLTLDVSDLPAKVYLLRVTYKGMTTSKKVVVGKP